jgi:hypothetical protein
MNQFSQLILAGVSNLVLALLRQSITSSQASRVTDERARWRSSAQPCYGGVPA